MVDNRQPRSLGPRKFNANKARQEQERNNQIMHENTILLNKCAACARGRRLFACHMP